MKLQKMIVYHSDLSALPPNYSIHGGILYFNGRLVLAKSLTLNAEVLREFHESPSAGHPGIDRTFCRIATIFFLAWYME